MRITMEVNEVTDINEAQRHWTDSLIGKAPEQSLRNKKRTPSLDSLKYSEGAMSIESIEIVIPDYDDDDFPIRSYSEDRVNTAPSHNRDHKNAKENFNESDMALSATPPCTAPSSIMRPKDKNQINVLLMESIEDSRGLSAVSSEIMDIPSALCSPGIDAKLIAHNADRQNTAPFHSDGHRRAKKVFTELNVGRATSPVPSAPSKTRRQKETQMSELLKILISTEISDGGVHHTDDDILETLHVTSDLYDDVISCRESRMHSSFTTSTESMDLPSGLGSPDWKSKAFLYLMERNSSAPGHSNDHKKAKKVFTEINVGWTDTPPCSAPSAVMRPKEEEEMDILLMNESAASREHSVIVMSPEIVDIPSALCSPSIDAKLIGYKQDQQASAPAHTRDSKKANDVFKEINMGRVEIPSCSAPSRLKRLKKEKEISHLHLDLPDGLSIEINDGGVHHTDDDILDVLHFTSDLFDSHVGRGSRMHSEYSTSNESMELPTRLCSPDWDSKPKINLNDRNCSAPGHTHDHGRARHVFAEINVGKSHTPPCTAPSGVMRLNEEDELDILLMESEVSREHSVKIISPEILDIPSELCSPSIDAKLIGHNLDRHGTAPAYTYDYRKAKDVFTEINVGHPPSPIFSAPTKSRKHRRNKKVDLLSIELPKRLLSMEISDGGVHHTDDDILDVLHVTSDLVEGYIDRESRMQSEYSSSNESIELPSRFCSPDWDAKTKINLMDRNCSAPGYTNDYRQAKQVFTQINLRRRATPPCTAPAGVMRPNEEDELDILLMEKEDSRSHSIHLISPEIVDIPSGLCSPSIEAKLIGCKHDKQSSAPAHTRGHKEAKEVFSEINVGRLPSPVFSAPAKLRKETKNNKSEIEHFHMELPDGLAIEISDGGVHHTDDDILEALHVTSDLVDDYISRDSRMHSEYSLSNESMELPSRLCSPDWDVKTKINMMERNCSAPSYTNDYRQARQVFTEINVGRRFTTPPCTAPPSVMRPQDKDEFDILFVQPSEGESRGHSAILRVSPEVVDIPSELCSPSIDAKLIAHNIDRHGTAPAWNHEYRKSKKVFTEINVGTTMPSSSSAPSKLKIKRKEKQTSDFILTTKPPIATKTTSKRTKQSSDSNEHKPGIMITVPSDPKFKPVGKETIDLQKTTQEPIEPKIIQEDKQENLEPQLQINSKEVNEWKRYDTTAKATQTSGKNKNGFPNYCGIENQCCGRFAIFKPRVTTRNSSVCTIS